MGLGFNYKLFHYAWRDVYLLRHSLDLKRQENKRIVIKEVISAIEATTKTMKDECIYILENYRKISISHDLSDWYLLEDQSIDIGKNGNAIAKNKYYATEPNMLYALNSFIKFNKIRKRKVLVGFISNFKSQLPLVMKIRNRLTHPKSMSALRVSDEEYDLVDNFRTNYEKMLDYLLEHSIFLNKKKRNKYD